MALPIVTDLDLLNLGTEVILDVTNKKIEVTDAGNLAGAKVSMQCLYSFLVKEWKNDNGLIQYPFIGKFDDNALVSYFRFKYGWELKDINSINKVANSGFAYVDENGVIVAEFMNIRTLGNFDSTTDKAYYRFDTGVAVDFVYTDVINEAVQIYGDANHGNITRPSEFTAYLRIQGKTYDEYQLVSSQNTGTLTYRSYSLPLSNKLDTKITADDVTVDGYGVTATYLPSTGFTTFADTTVYEANSVVQDSTGRWFITATGGTSSTAGALDVASDTGITDWVSYSGERLIQGNYCAFDRILDGNTRTKEEIYSAVQSLLRKDTDIDSGTGTVIGDTASSLLKFVGDTLVTSTGVYIDNFNDNDINSIEFFDATNVKRTFPYYSAGSLQPNDNIKAEDSGNTKFAMFFAAGYDSANAVIVQDKDGVDITGTFDADTNVTFSFDYDGNVQEEALGAGARTAGTDANVKVVVVGTDKAQPVIVDAVITKSKGINIALPAAEQLSYLNP